MNWLKNWIFGKKAPAKEDLQTRYLSDSLAFTKQQQQTLLHKQNEHERWQRHYGSLHIDELKKLSGIEFEDYLHKDQHLIAVQAKCYAGSVSVSAVQEALFGMAYYSCHSAWVVTLPAITPLLPSNSPDNPRCDYLAVMNSAN